MADGETSARSARGESRSRARGGGPWDRGRTRLPSPPRPARMNRRAFLVASGAGLAGLSLIPDTSAAMAAGPVGASAHSTILFFLCGGASHIDTWDLKPDAPAEYRGPFRPIATSAPGVRLCEHLPLLARQAHHLAVVNSVGATVEHQRPPRRVLLQPHRPRPGPELPDAGQRPHAAPGRLALHGLRGRPRGVPPHPRPAERDHAAAQAEQGPLHAARAVRRPAGDRARPALRPRRHATSRSTSRRPR